MTRTNWPWGGLWGVGGGALPDRRGQFPGTIPGKGGECRQGGGRAPCTDPFLRYLLGTGDPRDPAAHHGEPAPPSPRHHRAQHRGGAYRERQRPNLLCSGRPAVCVSQPGHSRPAAAFHTRSVCVVPAVQNTGIKPRFVSPGSSRNPVHAVCRRTPVRVFPHSLFRRNPVRVLADARARARSRRASQRSPL